MKKTEIFSQVLSAVSAATEIDPAEIVSRSRKEEVVEARLLLVHCCTEKGLRPVQIASLVGHTPHNVYRSLRSAADRYKYSSSFRFDCDLLCKQLGITM